MKEEVYFTNSKQAIRVCIDKISGVHISGRILCPPDEDLVAFEDLGLLPVALEKALDRRGYPYACQKKRSFFTEPSHEGAQLYYHKLRQAQADKLPNNQLVPFGICQTFLIHIISRRSSNWQGIIEWLEDGAVESFESDITLLRRITARLNDA